MVVEVVVVGAESAREQTVIQYAVVLASKRCSIGMVCTCGRAGNSRARDAVVCVCRHASVSPNEKPYLCRQLLSQVSEGSQQKYTTYAHLSIRDRVRNRTTRISCSTSGRSTNTTPDILRQTREVEVRPTQLGSTTLHKELPGPVVACRPAVPRPSAECTSGMRMINR